MTNYPTHLFCVAGHCSAAECLVAPTRVGISLQPAGIVVAWWCETHAQDIETRIYPLEPQQEEPMTELKPIKARLTNEQWAALGRFQSLLSAILLPNIEYRFEVMFYDVYLQSPTVEVQMNLPGDDFTIYDDAIARAFEVAKVPGYEWDGVGHNREKQKDIRHGYVWVRSITFSERPSAES